MTVTNLALGDCRALQFTFERAKTCLQEALMEDMVNDPKLACNALLELEEEDWKDTALGMLHSTSHGAGLQQLVLHLRGSAALAGAVRAFVYQNQDKITARGLMRLPLPQLTARLSPCSSHSQTRPRCARTFSDVLLWDSFSQGANQLLLSLDDQAARHSIPGISCESPLSPLKPASDAAEVRAHVTDLTHSVNEIAARIGIPAECVGGGHGRSSSFTDLVVRQTGLASDPQHLSAISLGVGEVKGDWQLSIKRGLELFDAVRSEAELGDFLPGLQQVYGDGVMDEAPLLILTNYHVTFFLRRSASVMDKRLWASPAVWWDQTDPPPRVCWLYALQQAQQLQPLKASLPRVAVPYTLMGHPLPLLADSDGETESNSPSRASKRQRTAAQQAAQQVIVLNAHSTSGKGYEKHSLAAELPAPATGGIHPLDGPALPDSLATEPVLGMDTLALSDTLLGAGRYGQVLQGHYHGERVAVKLYDLERCGSAEAFRVEKAAYGALKALQGSVLPKLLKIGILAHVSLPAVVTSIGGQPLMERLTRSRRVPQELRRPLKAALQELHRAGVAHGDVCMSNILVRDNNAVCLIDLGSAMINADEDAKAQDLKRAKGLFDILH